MDTRYVTRNEIARRLGVSVTFVHYEIEKGTLPKAVDKIGREERYSAVAVDKAIRQNFSVLLNRKKYLRVDQVAKQLKRSIALVKYLARTNVLPPGVVQANRLFFEAKAIAAFIKKTKGILPPSPGRRTRPDLRSEAEQLLADGVGVREVSQRLELGRRTVNRFDLERRKRLGMG